MCGPIVGMYSCEHGEKDLKNDNSMKMRQANHLFSSYKQKKSCLLPSAVIKEFSRLRMEIMTVNHQALKRIPGHGRGADPEIAHIRAHSSPTKILTTCLLHESRFN